VERQRTVRGRGGAAAAELALKGRRAVPHTSAAARERERERAEVGRKGGRERESGREKGGEGEEVRQRATE
jgi:hypothetical protein